MKICYAPLEIHPALHSNLVLFKSKTTEGNFFWTYLYIPIWFYSNRVWISQEKVRQFFTFQSGSIQIFGKSKLERFKSIFTFQSGSIQIKGNEKMESRKENFTFQSGSIQILMMDLSDEGYTALHSNLVLFKLHCIIACVNS